MSHSTVMVVVRNADSPFEAQTLAEEALAPFNEQLDEPRRTEVEDDFVFEAVDKAEKRLANPEEDMLLPFGEKPQEGTAEYHDWVARVLNWWDGDSFEYDEDMAAIYRVSHYNPDGKWDWYSLGGRWRGFFQVKDGVQTGFESTRAPEWERLVNEGKMDPARGQVGKISSETRAILGESGSFGSPDGENFAQRADLARKGDIDFDAMRSLAGHEAEQAYDKFEAATEGIEPIAQTWKEFAEERSARGESIEDIRKAYHSHPWVKALREANLAGWFGELREDWCVDAGGREAYVERARQDADSTFAILVDGEWKERGNMGWFAIVTDENADWDTERAAILDSLDDDVWLAVYDVHI